MKPYEFTIKPVQMDPQKSSPQRTPSLKQIQTLNVQKLEKYVLSVQNNLLKKQVQLYEWRQKTDFPIVKIQSYKILDQRLQKTHIQIIINSCHQKINQLKELKIEEATVLIKEAFIGFQRLLNKFRFFQVKSQMIIIDHKGKCRVWINSNFSLNQVQSEVKDFSTFYKSIVCIFQQITIKNPTSMSFYLSLKQANCFIKGLKFIQDFIKAKKLKPNYKQQMMKKISSTPNLIFDKIDKKTLAIEEEGKNLRQTIGYLRKREYLQHRDSYQVMTFSAKNSKPLQKRLQQMIQQIPKHQIVEKNNIVLEKLIESKNQNGKQDHHLKKVFKSIKEFKFRKTRNQQNNSNNQKNTPVKTKEIKSEALQKSLISQKVKAQTMRPNLQLNRKQSQGYFTKNVPQTCKNIEDGSRFSVTQTRSTSFFNNSGDRFNNESSTNSTKKFGNIKFSQISHKKNSQISEFNKEIQNILFSIDGDKPKPGSSNKQTVSEENIASKSMHVNCDYTRPVFSALDQEQLYNQNFKKLAQTRPTKDFCFKNVSPVKNDNTASVKYGQITDQIEQPTAEQLSKKYIQLGWKPALDIFNLDNQTFQMKKSFHATEDQQYVSGIKNKQPVKLVKLDRIRSKQLAQSVLNEDYLCQ